MKTIKQIFEETKAANPDLGSRALGTVFHEAVESAIDAGTLQRDEMPTEEKHFNDPFFISMRVDNLKNAIKQLKRFNGGATYQDFCEIVKERSCADHLWSRFQKSRGAIEFLDSLDAENYQKFLTHIQSL